MGISDFVKGKPETDSDNSHSRVQVKMAAYGKKKGMEYVANSAVPMGGGKWDAYFKKPGEPKAVKLSIANAELG